MSQISRHLLGTGAAAVETLTGNSGGAVPPTGGNINVVGDGVTADVSGDPGTSTLTITSGLEVEGTTIGATTVDLYTRLFILNSGATLIAEVVAVTNDGLFVSGGTRVGVVRFDTTSGVTTVVGNYGNFSGQNVPAAAPLPDEPVIEFIPDGANGVILRATGVDTVTYLWKALIRVIQRP